jgi:hypothetical protein
VKNGMFFFWIVFVKGAISRLGFVIAATVNKMFTEYSNSIFISHPPTHFRVEEILLLLPSLSQ